MSEEHLAERDGKRFDPMKLEHCVLAMTALCGLHCSNGAAPSGDAGTSPTATCERVPEAEVPPYGISTAVGTVTGSGVSAALCPGGEFASIEAADAGSPAPFVFGWSA